jgi:hypothetical protein
VTYPFGRDVTLYREDRNDFGDPTLVLDRSITGVAVAPRTSTEPGQDRRTATVTTGLTLYLPPGAEPPTAQHTVELDDGSRWRVVGDPARWDNPLTGWEPGHQVEIERVEG